VVDMIVQNASASGTTDISFTIHEDELEDARKVLMPIVSQIGANRLYTASGVAKLSVVGIGMRSHSGVAARMFECLGKAGINIQLVSTSEIKIAVVIDGNNAERAARVIHAEFGLARLMPAGVLAQTLSTNPPSPSLRRTAEKE
ncbi:MAG: ACT domain-containing protein, partial [Chthoniobacterales bacterium]